MRFNVLPLRKQQQTEVLQQKVSYLESQMHAATTFVKEIEKGNLDVNYENQIHEDEQQHELASSLISLRNRLKEYSVQEKERNWVSEGLAKFIDILRSSNNDMSILTDNILRNLVKYMQANQGALYIVNEHDPQDIHLKMAACFAYDRKKYLDKRFEIGEGIAGQIVLEKETIYMTNIPDDYLEITSGLGHASPRHLLVVPLKIEEKVLGVIELASFNPIKKYHIDFVERLGESIASTVSNVNISEQTGKLLQETQYQAEQMRSQEEEMRQNMEELSATQDEMQRVLKEAQEKELYLNNLLNASTDSVLTIDRNYKVVMFNTAVRKIMELQGIEVVKGMDVKAFSSNENWQNNQEKFSKAFQGETVETTDEFQGYYFHSVYQPLRDASGEVTGILLISRNITKDVQLHNQTEELLNAEKLRLEELSAQEEELRQNMEELSATQEEMQRILEEVQEKERYLNELINASDDSIFTVDREYRLISANKSLSEAITGMGIKEVKGFDMLSFYPDPIAKSNYQALFDRAFAGENFQYINEHTQDGHTSYYTTNFAPLTNAKGEIYAVASFAKDTTQVMRALNEVQEKERYLNELINVPKDSIFTLDRNYRILSANKALISGLQGMGIKEAIGFDMLSLYPDGEAKSYYKSLIDRAFAGENFEHTNDFVLEGNISYYTTNYAPVRNSAGEIFAVASFSKDTTAIIAAQKQAEQMTEEIRAQEEELRQNLEELAATQEEMERLLKESQDKEYYLEELINVSQDSILTIDKDFKIISCNKVLADQYAALGIPGFGKGSDPLSILPEDQKKQQIALYNRVLKGETIKMTQEFTVQGVTTHVSMTMHPLKDTTRGIFAVAIISKDITETVNNQRKLEELLKGTGDRIN